jgi:hypothetical protein
MENLDHHVSLSFVAAHGSDKFLLRNILDTYSLIQDQVVLASKLETAPVTNVDVDVNASELLKEKVCSANSLLFFGDIANNLFDINFAWREIVKDGLHESD